MVVWIIGLSGAGKTTLATEVVTQIRKKQENVILLDGDMIREAFGNDLGHSMGDRLLNAQRICQLGKLLDEQGIHVVCAILSIFPETRAWNRNNLKNYFEVFIDSPIETLIERDSKGIYSQYDKGEIDNVAGLDLDFPVPENADLVIKNISDKDKLLSHAEEIMNTVLGST